MPEVWLYLPVGKVEWKLNDITGITVLTHASACISRVFDLKWINCTLGTSLISTMFRKISMREMTFSEQTLIKAISWVLSTNFELV